MKKYAGLVVVLSLLLLGCIEVPPAPVTAPTPSPTPTINYSEYTIVELLEFDTINCTECNVQVLEREPAEPITPENYLPQTFELFEPCINCMFPELVASTKEETTFDNLIDFAVETAEQQIKTTNDYWICTEGALKTKIMWHSSVEPTTSERCYPNTEKISCYLSSINSEPRLLVLVVLCDVVE